ncbi:unnamed protein product [Bursaphelenchus xylophilus]|uniref:(pine wood nematode) hypothetical protein n=1 Tax=Bursaphelenchus xylophilus TaxID=6326 RepID=A0A811M3W3_BURXY|nr:unnamed protein product [Bursaphelenchus xylophilus]CAG9131689.1 unnamed protein product [Bursaphelenchus xylophilus]
MEREVVCYIFDTSRIKNDTFVATGSGPPLSAVPWKQNSRNATNDAFIVVRPPPPLTTEQIVLQPHPTGQMIHDLSGYPCAEERALLRQFVEEMSMLVLKWQMLSPFVKMYYRCCGHSLYSHRRSPHWMS